MSQLISFSRNPFNWFISFLRHHSSVNCTCFMLFYFILIKLINLFIIYNYYYLCFLLYFPVYIPVSQPYKM